MDWTSGHYIQLIIALSAGIILFTAAYTLPMRIVVWALFLLIPFQIINSRYGSINMVLTYMVGAAFLLRGRIERLPLLGVISFIMFAYLLSTSQMLPGTTRDHGIYMISTTSNFMLFYLAYNYVRANDNWRDMWNILVVLNLLVILYCIIEMLAGMAGIQLFGLTELEIKSGRAEQGRLSGPFRATALTAEYLGIQSLICIYALMRLHGNRTRVFWGALLASNLGLMIATGNRGGVVSLVVGLMALLLLFKKELGVFRTVTWIVSGSIVFIISAFIVVQYTQYNVLFERLKGTEFEGVLPDTRNVWVNTWDQVISKPVLGHGPRLRLEDEYERRIPGHTPIPYPHSGYLYLIYTIGFLGLFAYIGFFTVLLRHYWRGRSSRGEDSLLSGLPRLGVAILVLFAVSQLRMEMFRFILHAYQQYLFMLVGVFLAFSHMAISRSQTEGVSEKNIATTQRRSILQVKRSQNSD